MIKMTMLLKRNANITHAEFVQHHREQHGPLFRSIPEATMHVLRYIQTHPITGNFPVPQADFDGTAEIWFDSPDGMRAVLNSDTYRHKVFPDEESFLDHAKTVILVGEQTGIIEGRV